MGIEEFVLERIQLADNGCWLWTGSKDKDGYGLARGRRAHRLAYELWVGEIADGLVIDHIYEAGCRHYSCINPEHLEPVTQKENVHRERSRRTACPQGHPYDKLDNRGERICLTCRREASRRWWLKNRKKVA